MTCINTRGGSRTVKKRPPLKLSAKNELARFSTVRDPPPPPPPPQ